MKVETKAVTTEKTTSLSSEMVSISPPVVVEVAVPTRRMSGGGGEALCTRGVGFGLEERQGEEEVVGHTEETLAAIQLCRMDFEVRDGGRVLTGRDAEMNRTA